MGIIAGFSCICTTVGLHILNLNNAWKKAIWELCKVATLCFEQILEAAAFETASVQSLISQTMQIRWARHGGLCWRSKDEPISEILLWTLTHEHTSVGQLWKSCIHQLCADTGYCLENLPRVMANRDGWWEKFKESVLSTHLDDVFIIKKHIFCISVSW